MKSIYYVYELVNPIDNRTFYVGHTNNHDRRLGEHLKLKTSTSARIIKLLLENNIIPYMKIVYECNNKVQACGVEKFLIAEYKQNGHFLGNHMNTDKRYFMKNLVKLNKEIKLQA